MNKGVWGAKGDGLIESVSQRSQHHYNVVLVFIPCPPTGEGRCEAEGLQAANPPYDQWFGQFLVPKHRACKNVVWDAFPV
ncbi:hypothetical protein, partial [Deinococcus sp. Arct2-2]|uniref:hypothetical protein n=1 Tax=Deinococcus sp. Arct2-2 TaxID=2568653 RepID=UPI00197A771C